MPETTKSSSRRLRPPRRRRLPLRDVASVGSTTSGTSTSLTSCPVDVDSYMMGMEETTTTTSSMLVMSDLHLNNASHTTTTASVASNSSNTVQSCPVDVDSFVDDGDDDTACYHLDYTAAAARDEINQDDFLHLLLGTTTMTRPRSIAARAKSCPVDLDEIDEEEIEGQQHRVGRLIGRARAGPVDVDDYIVPQRQDDEERRRVQVADI